MDNKTLFHYISIRDGVELIIDLDNYQNSLNGFREAKFN